MTKSGIKTEDYREITPYWCNRLLLYKGRVKPKDFWSKLRLGDLSTSMHEITSKPFDNNLITLGYPKANDSDRILTLKHKGIETNTGNPEWGAVPGKIYFVVKHGKIIK